jgi:hypothetical protein
MRQVELAHVEVVPEPGSNYVCVYAIWKGVDRPKTHGIVCTKPNAKRLERAIRAGVVFADTEIRTDVDGNTYAQTSHEVMGKYLNSGLRKLGY